MSKGTATPPEELDRAREGTPTSPTDLEQRRENHRMKLQRELVRFACRTYGATCIAAIILFYLQGFHLFGFWLDSRAMYWIGGTTIGAIGGLTATICKDVFQPRSR